MKIYFCEGNKTVAWQLLVIPAFFGLLAAFYLFESYVAAIALIILFIFFLVDFFELVIIKEDCIKHIKWAKVLVTISLDEVEEINTTAGEKEGLVIYGTNDIIQCAYRRKMFIELIKLIGVDEKNAEAFINEEDNISCEDNNYTLIREVVFLDRLIGKEKYIHRRVIDHEKRNIS